MNRRNLLQKLGLIPAGIAGLFLGNKITKDTETGAEIQRPGPFSNFTISTRSPDTSMRRLAMQVRVKINGDTIGWAHSANPGQGWLAGWALETDSDGNTKVKTENGKLVETGKVYCKFTVVDKNTGRILYRSA